MLYKDKLTLDTVLKHKSYFDERLVEIVETLRISDSKKSDEIKFLKEENRILMKSSRDAKKEVEDIRKENEKLIRELRKMKEEVDKETEELKKSYEELEKQRRLNEIMNKKFRRMESSNSTNSNMPSSHDILSHSKPKKKVQNSRVSTGRKRGGQAGHILHKSCLTPDPDQIIYKYVNEAPSGAVTITDDNGYVLYYATQEIDMELKSVVCETRYLLSPQYEELDDETAKKYKINPVTYTSHFKSVVIYLNERGTVPYKRLCEIVNDISKGTIHLQESSIIKWENEFHRKSEVERERIKEEILSEKVVHADETSFKLDGGTGWIHGITNPKGTYFIAEKKRSDEIDKMMEILSEFTNVLEHDHFKKYYSLDLCQHAECNAHIDRYLKGCIDFDRNEACQEILDTLHEALEEKYALQSKGIQTMSVEKINEYKKKIVEVADAEIEKYKKECQNDKYKPDYVNLLKRISKYVDEHLRFIEDFDVPYTNNAAERQCRAIKTKKNVSGQFVSIKNAQNYADIMTIIQTSKLRQQNVLESIEKIMSRA